MLCFSCVFSDFWKIFKNFLSCSSLGKKKGNLLNKQTKKFNPVWFRILQIKVILKVRLLSVQLSYIILYWWDMEFRSYSNYLNNWVLPFSCCLLIISVYIFAELNIQGILRGWEKVVYLLKKKKIQNTIDIWHSKWCRKYQRCTLSIKTNRNKSVFRFVQKEKHLKNHLRPIWSALYIWRDQILLFHINLPCCRLGLRDSAGMALQYESTVRMRARNFTYRILVLCFTNSRKHKLSTNTPLSLPCLCLPLTTISAVEQVPSECCFVCLVNA